MRFNKELENLKIYEAGKPIELVIREFGIDEKDIIKLASNENPYGSSQRVIEAVKSIVNKMHLYPDDSMFELKEELSKRFRVDSKNIIIGAGSDQVLEFVCRAVLNSNSKALMSKITFAMYEIYSLQQGAKILRTSCYRHDLDEFYDIYKKENPEIIFICTPNNPTGDAIDKEHLYSFLKKCKDALVVVDGAYMEYAVYKDEKKRVEPMDLIKNFDNVLYLGTFSKAYGLGGMRVGYGISNEKIIKNLYKLRPPFNITTLSLRAAIEALKDEEFVKKSVEKSFLEMQKYINFAFQKGLDFIDSYTNFITYLLPKEHPSSLISKKLLQKGVIIRDLSGYGMNALRITIGTKEQNDIFFKKFDEVLHGH